MSDAVGENSGVRTERLVWSDQDRTVGQINNGRSRGPKANLAGARGRHARSALISDRSHTSSMISAGAVCKILALDLRLREKSSEPSFMRSKDIAAPALLLISRA